MSMRVEFEHTTERKKPASLGTILREIEQGLPIVSITNGEKVGCNNCVGACCKAGMVLSLSPKEKEQIESAGTDIEQYQRKRGEPKPKRGESLYKFNLDCGNLQSDNSCGIYEDRPRACRDLTTGSAGCLFIREARGLRHTVEPPQQGY